MKLRILANAESENVGDSKQHGQDAMVLNILCREIYSLYICMYMCIYVYLQHI